MTTETITTAIEAEIANLDATIRDMTARRVTLIECRTMLTAKTPQSAPEKPASVAPVAKATTTPKKASKPSEAHPRKRGERVTLRAKLSSEDLAQVREWAAKGLAHSVIASGLDNRVSTSTIGNIVNRKGCYADM